MCFKYSYYILLGFFFLVVGCTSQTAIENRKSGYHKIDQLLSEAGGAHLDMTGRHILIDSAFKLLKNQPTDTLKNQEGIKISTAYWITNNYEQYNAVSQYLLKWGKQLKDTATIARAYGNISAYFDKQDLMDSAYYYAYNANKLYKAVGDEYRIGRSYIKMGIAQMEKGDLIGAEASMVEATQYFIKIDNIIYLSFALNNLGLINQRLGNYDMALADHEKSLQYKRRIKDNDISIAITLLNIANIYIKKGEPELAKQYFEQALRTKNILNDSPENYVNILIGLNKVKLLQNDFAGFPFKFKKPLEISDSINYVDGVVSANLDLATYYKAINKLDLAKIFASKANILSREAGFDNELLTGLLLLSEVTTSAEALKYSKQYIRLNDSIKNEERRFINQFARIRFDTDQLEIENKAFEREKELYAMLAFGIFALGILIYLVKRQQSLRKQLAFEQRQKLANEEIYNLMLSQQLKLNEGKLIERQRFSKELHDGILGKLFGVRLSLDSLNVNGNEESSAKMKNLYVDELKSIEHEVRQISHDLSSELFASDLGFSEIMEDLIINQCELHGLEYDFENEQAIGWEKVPSFIKMNLYRILQETLQNINKYANATAVKVEFSKNDERIKMLIEDNGKGFNVARNRGGIGLKNINSRSRDINGSCIIESAIGKGTKVIIEFSVLPTNQKEEV